MQGGGLLEVSTVRLTLGEGEAPGHLGLDLWQHSTPPRPGRLHSVP